MKLLTILISLSMSLTILAGPLEDALRSGSHLSVAEVDQISTAEIEAKIEEIKKTQWFDRYETNSMRQDYEENLLGLQKLSSILDFQVKDAGLDPKKVEVFLIGGGMEGFFHYFRLTGTSILEREQFHQLKISRPFFEENEGKVKEYIAEVTRKAMESNKTLLIMDSTNTTKTISFVQNAVDELIRSRGSGSQAVSLGILEGRPNDAMPRSIKDVLSSRFTLVNIGWSAHEVISSLAARFYNFPRFFHGKFVLDKDGRAVSKDFMPIYYEKGTSVPPLAILKRLFSMLWMKKIRKTALINQSTPFSCKGLTAKNYQ